MNRINASIVLIILIICFTSCEGASDNKNDNTTLLNAVDEIGNFDICAQELDKGASPDYVVKSILLNKQEISLIKTSLDAHNLKMAEFLLKKGANPDYVFDKKKEATLLMYASGYENSGISVDGVVNYNNAKILLDYGADINKLDKDGMSALDHSLASESMNIGVNDLLLEKNIKISTNTIEVLNKRLISNNEKNLIENLLDYFLSDNSDETKSDLDFWDYKNAREIYIRALKNNIDLSLSEPMTEIVTCSDNKCITNINKLHEEEVEAALCFTASFGNVNTMKEFVNIGIDINQTWGSDDDTLLSLAAKYHNNSMIKYLVELGSDTNASNWYGKPINRAAESGDDVPMTLLLNNGASIMTMKKDEYFPEDSTLCRAAMFGNVDGINLINETLGTQITLNELFVACKESIINGELQSLKLLLDICHERDYYPEDELVSVSVTNSNKSPYANLEVLKYLIENGANVNGGKGDEYGLPIGTAVAQSEVESLKYLIDNGAAVNNELQHEDGNLAAPCIYDAVAIGNLDIIKILVEAGANLDYEYNGETPLEYAKDLGNEYTANYLLTKT